ncbi:glycosyltransferase family 4 protein [Sphingobacterium phlebotomi]|uniref:Glycosyltransferase family 4 protein n=1 Tax=Sphingobacterium phlebotomi TaxID=2605433 RepID=A0A5D4H8B4_9SPHI|nr:glycosyltransferase [Sphingobacterium phlebotomi]TYR36522.1 glycosyltransferase family 4 protein [Sphingobacterium phlebotomi]
MKTIVISAVNITEAGPLAILKDCLSALSQWVGDREGRYRVIAIVFKRGLADYPHIEYIETQWPKKRWVNRLWYEYVTLKKVSKDIGDIYLWFSLHDTSPSVKARHRVVYCHNALFGYRWKLHDVFFAPTMAILAMLTKYIYRPNIHRNDYVIAQQEWFRKAMHQMFNIEPNRIIVAPPTSVRAESTREAVPTVQEKLKTFIYAASPNNHKNFEIVCRAVDILENQCAMTDFCVYITIDGEENAYTKWLYRNWGKLKSLQFIGFLQKEVLQNYYRRCDCLIFPSKAESWGLPISEFTAYDKYMLLADLPYTHETAGGSKRTAFFDADKPEELAKLMKELIEGETQAFQPVPVTVVAEPIAEDWSVLFNHLLSESR